MQQGIAHTVVVHIVSDVVGGGLGLGGRIAHRDPDAGVGEHIRVIAAIAEGSARVFAHFGLRPSPWR